MKIKIFETICDNILFILLGLAVTNTNNSMMIINNPRDFSLNLTFSNHLVLFSICLIVYAIVEIIISRKQNGSCRNTFRHLFTSVQLFKDTDERDVIITQKASKVGYFMASGFAFISIFLLLLYKIFGTWLNLPFADFDVAIWLFIFTMLISNISFSIKWCLEYQK